MTFRQIDIEGMKPATLRDQPAPTLVWAEVKNLIIDDRYQRALTAKGRGAIQRMANDWDWSKYQPILVASTPDGSLAVVDGQHRAHAGTLVGLDRLPAMIVPMTPEQQAAAFTAVNTARLRLDQASVFKARIASGDRDALAAHKVCEDAGCRLMPYNKSANQKKPGELYCHGLILRMMANGEQDAVLHGLRAICASELGSDHDLHGRRAYDGAVLNVWLPAIARSQQFLRLPLADVFDGIAWDELGDECRRRARITGGSGRALMIDRVVASLRAAQEAA
jgi:hypothetical protein